MKTDDPLYYSGRKLGVSHCGDTDTLEIYNGEGGAYASILRVAYFLETDTLDLWNEEGAASVGM